MDHLFLGSHPALDFLNTAYAPDGRQIETIGNGTAFLDWLAEARLLAGAQRAGLAERWSGTALDALATEARSMREWARDWLVRWRDEPTADYTAEFDALNERLSAIFVYRQVTEERTLVERIRLEDEAAVLGLVAMQIAALVTEEDGTLVRSCAGTGCTLWFLDRTKAHRRIYCSAALCGNRAKVAAFRERARSG
jgi:predicted RNA-binding Zn ribbon-like protein